jgi:LPS O-antigen subunit length determinant protein (WzzB/FepE family)
MYATETQDDADARLDEQIAQDSSGELRDRLIDELYLAARELEEQLVGNPNQADAQTIRDLLEAVRLSEALVAAVWQAFHGGGHNALAANQSPISRR